MCKSSFRSIAFKPDSRSVNKEPLYRSGGGLTRPISGDGGADQLRGVPIIGQPPRDETRGPE